MRIEYDVSMSDLVHFQKYHWRHSPGFQWQYRFGFLASPLLGLICAVTMVGWGRPLRWTFVFLTGAVVYAAVYEWCVRLSLRSTLKRVLSEGKNRGIIGRHIIEIEATGLRERTDVNDTLHTWAGIERIETDEEFIFIYIGALMAHCIPRSAFEHPEDAERFLTAARGWKAAMSAA